MNPSADLLTVHQVAKRLQVTERTVYAMVKKRELIYIKVGSLLRFREEDLEEYLGRHVVSRNGTKRKLSKAG